MTDFTEKAFALTASDWQLPHEERANRIATALREAHEAGRLEGLKRAADLVDAHEEVTHLKSGKRLLHDRTAGNMVGLAYAEAIRALGRKA